VSDRSGVGLVELAVLQTLEALTAGRPRAHVSSARAVAGIEERIGLGPTYGYELLADLTRPWMIPIRTVSGLGNFGDRDCPEPSEPPYTVCRQSREIGRIVITDVPVPEAAADRPVPPDRRGWTGWEPKFDRPMHLMIETLPAQTTTPDAARAIANRAKARAGTAPIRNWPATHPCRSPRYVTCPPTTRFASAWSWSRARTRRP
jgi:hypothetical protein